MNVLGASAKNQIDFQFAEPVMPVEPEFETNIYLESVLPSEASLPHSFQSVNPKLVQGETILGFRVLPKNPLS